MVKRTSIKNSIRSLNRLIAKVSHSERDARGERDERSESTRGPNDPRAPLAVGLTGYRIRQPTRTSPSSFAVLWRADESRLAPPPRSRRKLEEGSEKRVKLEKSLAELEKKRLDVVRIEREKKNAKRYRGIRFVEWRKLDRKHKQLRRALAEAKDNVSLGLESPRTDSTSRPAARRNFLALPTTTRRQKGVDR